MLPDTRIQPGQTVGTSGGDQIFPHGLPVGTVEKGVPDKEHPPLVNVLIHPAVNLDAVEEVLVITETGSKIPLQEQNDIAQSELEQEQQRTADILAEQLPSTIDPEAPPEELYTSTVNKLMVSTPIAPLHPLQPAHPDQFTPGATPPAADMTPGALNGPILQGTENMPRPKPAAKPASGAGNPPGQAAAGATAGGGKTASAGAHGAKPGSAAHAKRVARQRHAATPQGGN